MHMIFVKGKKHPIEASKVKAGDYLILQKYHQAPQIADKVVSVEHDYLQGGFGPITEDGTIVVDGIVASCYSNPPYQTSEYVTIFGIRLIHRQTFTHMLKSPIRIICGYVTDYPCRIGDDVSVPYKMLGHVLLDKLHALAVKLHLEDLGEMLVGLLALGCLLVEVLLMKLTWVSTIGLGIIVPVAFYFHVDKKKEKVVLYKK